MTLAGTPLSPFHPHTTVVKPNSIPALDFSVTCSPAPIISHKNIISHLTLSPLPPSTAAPSWNVSMDTQAQQVVLHFSSRTHVTFSAAWNHPGLGQDSVVPPVYSVSQVWPSQGLAPTGTY